MFRKLLESVLKLGAYSAVLIILAGVWDYTQQRQTEAGGFTVAEYATSVADRYGPRVNQLASFAADRADTGFETGIVWAKSTGALAQFGFESSSHEERGQPRLEPQGITTLNELMVLASVNTDTAPETSLFPRARAVQ